MRISDWSSDVCSSDLPGVQRRRHFPGGSDVEAVHLRPQVLHDRRHGIGFHRIVQLHLGWQAAAQQRDALIQQAPFVGEKRRLADTVRQPGQALSADLERSEAHTSELQSLMRISYAVFCLNKKKKN